MLLKYLAKAQPHYERLLRKRYPSGWHSFDRTPWLHPWLTRSNLTNLREFSRNIREEAAKVASKIDSSDMRFAFVGNMANSSYQRLKALRILGVNASLYIHPGDTYFMSQPEWENFDGELPRGLHTLQEIRNAGLLAPNAEDSYCLPQDSHCGMDGSWMSFIRPADYARWAQYFSYLPTLQALQDKDALYTVQCPYLAYLSSRPYVATHMGGDIWYECSRGDSLGELQRHAFRRASALTVSNPWSPAFARRYRFNNMVILPMILSTEQYCPGPPQWREEWKSQTGGEFFVLSTARVDARYKGSDLALEGFAQFAARQPGARLVLTGWGADLDKFRNRLNELGIADRVLLLPPVGKKRLIQYLRSADCLLDQFVLGYFGLTALEAMSVGLPVIMRVESEQYEAFFDTGPPPVLNAATVDEVTDYLRRLAESANYRASVSSSISDWYKQSATPQAWGNCYRDLLVSAAVGHRFDFRESPLNSPLGKDELEYQAEELHNTPVFPNYH